jgi:hypothetical protein
MRGVDSMAGHLCWHLVRGHLLCDVLILRYLSYPTAPRTLAKFGPDFCDIAAIVALPDRWGYVRTTKVRALDPGAGHFWPERKLRYPDAITRLLSGAKGATIPEVDPSINRKPQRHPGPSKDRRFTRALV